ncbi:MAG: MFS transporter, partial [bacterium]
GQLISTLSIFASDQVGLDRDQIGLLFTVNGLMVAIFQLVVTHITKRGKPLGMLLLAGFLYAIGYFLVGWSVNFMMLILSVAVITLGEMVESPTA